MVKNIVNVVKHKSEKEILYIFIDISLKDMSHWNFLDLLESLHSL